MMRSKSTEREPRSGFTLVELLVVIAIIGVLVALLLPAVQAAREAARRAQCMNNFKQAGLALQNFHASQKKFPVGMNMWSGFGCASPPQGPFTDTYGWGWGTFILPYMEQDAVYDRFDFKAAGGYGTSDNLRAGAQFIPSYLCPSDAQGPELMDCCSTIPGPDLAGTNLAGVADSEDWSCDGTWPRPDPSRQINKRGANGILYQRSQTSAKDILDGTSNTLILGEVIGVGPGTNQGYFWVTWDLQHTGNGINLPLNMDPKPSPWSVSENGFASYHPGGCNFVLASGTVRFLNESMDHAVLQGLSTRAGEEVVDY
jgi:prepilin-type N-terminal cleavage/methylation domain-containing protein